MPVFGGSSNENLSPHIRTWTTDAVREATMSEGLKEGPLLEERYWCGCVRHARWERCDRHYDLDHDEEPKTQAEESAASGEGPDTFDEAAEQARLGFIPVARQKVAKTDCNCDAGGFCAEHDPISQWHREQKKQQSAASGGEPTVRKVTAAIDPLYTAAWGAHEVMAVCPRCHDSDAFEPLTVVLASYERTPATERDAASGDDELEDAHQMALEVLCRVFDDGADVGFQEWLAWYKPAEWIAPSRALGAFIHERLAARQQAAAEPVCSRGCPPGSCMVVGPAEPLCTTCGYVRSVHDEMLPLHDFASEVRFDTARGLIGPQPPVGEREWLERVATAEDSVTEISVGPGPHQIAEPPICPKCGGLTAHWGDCQPGPVEPPAFHEDGTPRSYSDLDIDPLAEPPAPEDERERLARDLEADAKVWEGLNSGGDYGSGDHRSYTVVVSRGRLRNTVERLRHAAALLRAAPAEREPDGWRPIETAPKDGTAIIVGAPCAPSAVDVVQWCADCWFRGWLAGGHRSDCYGPSFEPTHWMPLPDAPVQPEGGKCRVCEECGADLQDGEESPCRGCCRCGACDTCEQRILAVQVDFEADTVVQPEGGV